MNGAAALQCRRVASFVPSSLTLSLKRYDFFDLSRAFFPPIAMIVASCIFKGVVGERVVAIFLTANVLTLVYLLLFHTPIGSRLMTQDAYWIGAMEEFKTTPVFIICAAVRSRCFQKIMESSIASAEESDFTKTTGLVLLLIVANVWLLATLANASF